MNTIEFPMGYPTDIAFSIDSARITVGLDELDAATGAHRRAARSRPPVVGSPRSIRPRVAHRRHDRRWRGDSRVALTVQGRRIACGAETHRLRQRDSLTKCPKGETDAAAMLWGLDRTPA